ncbi:replication endonuclease, partial [Klebsiella quasipneumoniae]|nr:replication endonuclease [Klebsiella quasipneumoniae]
PRKGTPASYIAKYVSKNIDGRGLGDTVSKETGKSLRDSAEHVTAWASLHRVQQFRFFGIPGRQAYRELRLFASQATRATKTSKPGAPVLMDPKLDAVLAAADVGCFATYIMKQGGVLVPRKNYLIHTAYEPTVEPGTYGDHGIRVYGIWSTITGKENKICTHVHTWKMVKKTPANPGAESADQGDPVAPWTRSNNCPQDQKIIKKGTGIATPPPETAVSADEAGPLDPSKLPWKERQALFRRIRDELTVPAKAQKPAFAPENRPAVAELYDFAQSLGWDESNLSLLVRRLAAGGELSIAGRRHCTHGDGRIYSHKEPVSETDPEINRTLKAREIITRFNRIRNTKIMR